MRNFNIILSILSLNAFLTIVERLSFTGAIRLQPYDFLRLHEIIQMTIFILVSVIGPFLLIKIMSNNFALLKDTKGTLYAVLFVAGTYFYGLGEGLHEVASALFNTYCNTEVIESTMCGSMFVNDYYTGNVYFFVGLLMIDIALFLIERRNPQKKVTGKQLAIVLANSLVFTLTFIAYAAFDKVSVGLLFLILSMIVANGFLLTSNAKYRLLPFTLYASVAYTLATIATAIIRFY
ncbi:MAG: hypothetical protein HY429_03145 [Candidatus Levybacteria bacterium]|nr:hypothetical protein [Candidatus Levybacteria bacterium]